MDQSFRRYDHCGQERVRFVDRGRITGNNGLVLANGSAHRPHPHMLRLSTKYKLANDDHDTRSLRAYGWIKKMFRKCSPQSTTIDHKLSRAHCTTLLN
jgi:hypothetical protein